MEIQAVAHASDQGQVDLVEVFANGTRITIADAAGAAIHLTVIGADGGRPIVDVTIRAGPAGDGGV